MTCANWNSTFSSDPTLQLSLPDLLPFLRKNSPAVRSVYLFLIFHGGFHCVRHLMLFNRVTEMVDVAELILSVYHACNVDYNLFIMPVVSIENPVFNPSMSLSFALSY